MFTSSKWSLFLRFSHQKAVCISSLLFMPYPSHSLWFEAWLPSALTISGRTVIFAMLEYFSSVAKSISKDKYFLFSSIARFAVEVFLQLWVWTVCIEYGPDGLIFVPYFTNIVQYCTAYYYVGTGKSRYGICVNFYRPMDRVPPGGSLGGARGDRHSSTFRRESWRKSIEKSSDSAFSRLVTHPI